MSDDRQSTGMAEAVTLNSTEAEEREYHAEMTRKIGAALEAVHERVVARHEEMDEIKRYFRERLHELDQADKASLRQAADMASRVGEHAVETRKRLERLLQSPYFGRIDTRMRDAGGTSSVYIGVHSFADIEGDGPLVHDWRAPISSMFYDFELGEAHYEAPSGRIDCAISLKRQYRIERQEFRFMLESSLNIQDDILQEELSRASDDRLKNIVATIQRDQNRIIRDDRAHTLIIQGAAGSGKTSIALHRVAYLLYKYKDTIRSDDILIVSPNKVFAHYISRVLPELGEEMIVETTMEALADELLDGKYRFQTFAGQVSELLADRDPQFGERVRFKATAEFLDQLDAYISHVRSTNLQPGGITIGLTTLEPNWIAVQFRKRAHLAIGEQINGVMAAIMDHMKYDHDRPVAGAERTQLRSDLRKMFASKTLKTIYKDFYNWIGRPEMIKPATKGALEYSDVFPLVSMKMSLEGYKVRDRIKHVVIDEMQDYTPVQYRVISRLYPGKMTILGDRNQSVNPLSSSTAESIRDVLPDAECVYMQKSYRSTVEITRLAQSIVHNPDLIPIERHGDEPRIVGFRGEAAELEHILGLARAFPQSGYQSMGVICKTQKQAETLYQHLRAEAHVRLLDAASQEFGGGVIIATAYLAKGLEFDQVIVPFCTDEEYRSTIDRHMLYVAVTRAMHRLTITHTGDISSFLAS
jgi:DNA helicase-2/ATP-dependent DNA helicase PcrA